MTRMNNDQNVQDLQDVLTNDGKKYQKWITKMNPNMSSDPETNKKVYRERQSYLREVMKPNPDPSKLRPVNTNMVGVFVLETNQVLKSVRHYNKKLFEVVRDSYDKLKHHKGELKLYKESVEIDRSSLNKIIKIVEDDLIMKNLNKLPGSWGSLCLLTSVDDVVLKRWIKEKMITPQTTQIEIKKMKTGESTTSTDEDELLPNFMFVDFDELGRKLNEKDRMKIENLLVQLTDYGFEIEGIPLSDRRVS